MRTIVTFCIPDEQEYQLLAVQEGDSSGEARLQKWLADKRRFPVCTRCIVLYGKEEASFAHFFVHGQLLTWPACYNHAAYHDEITTLDGRDAWEHYHVEWEGDEAYLVPGKED